MRPLTIKPFAGSEAKRQILVALLSPIERELLEIFREAEKRARLAPEAEGGGESE